MEIPKDYIKCIDFEVKIKECNGFDDYSYLCGYYGDPLDLKLKDYTTPPIKIGNKQRFTLIKPLDRSMIYEILRCREIEYFNEIEYIPYDKIEHIDKLIKKGFGIENYDARYLGYLSQFMPENPIIEKLSYVKFTVDIPKEIIEFDKLLQQSNIEKYFKDISNNYFSHKFFENTIQPYIVYERFATKVFDNSIIFYCIKLPCRYKHNNYIDKIIKDSSNYIKNIVVDNKDLSK